MERRSEFSSVGTKENHAARATESKDIKDAFDLFDTDGTGFLAVTDFKYAIRALGFKPEADELKDMINEIDKGRTGRIIYKDFLRLMTLKMDEKSNREEEAFRLFDEHQKGVITFNDLKRVACELGENLTDKELRDMIAVADPYHDGVVNREAFAKMMQKAKRSTHRY